MHTVEKVDKVEGDDEVKLDKEVLYELQHSKKTGPKALRASTERQARIAFKKIKSSLGTRGLGLRAKPFIPAVMFRSPIPPSPSDAERSIRGSEFHEATNPKGIPVEAKVKLKVPRAWEQLQARNITPLEGHGSFKFGPGPSPNATRRRRRSSLLDPTAAAFAKSRPSRRSLSESIRETARDLRLQEEARKRQRVSHAQLCNVNIYVLF